MPESVSSQTGKGNPNLEDLRVYGKREGRDQYFTIHPGIEVPSLDTNE